MRVQKILFPALTVFWIGVIFSFSLQTGEGSGSLSWAIVQWFVNYLHVDVIIPPDVFHVLVRKGAHFTEYFILGAFAWLTWREDILRVCKVRRWMVVLLPILFTALVACCDEGIQLFVSGRAGALTDVLIDTCGGAAGVWLFHWLCPFKN